MPKFILKKVEKTSKHEGLNIGLISDGNHLQFTLQAHRYCTIGSARVYITSVSSICGQIPPYDTIRYLAKIHNITTEKSVSMASDRISVSFHS